MPFSQEWGSSCKSSLLQSGLSLLCSSFYCVSAMQERVKMSSAEPDGL